MKLLIRNDPQSLGGPRGNQSSYEVPNGTITWLTIIYLVVNVLATSAGNYITNKPQRDIDNKNLAFKEQNFKLQLLQRVLEIDDKEERRASLQLLLAAGLMGDKKDEFQRFINDPKTVIAKWPKRPLESLNGSSQAAGEAAVSGGTGSATQSSKGKDSSTLSGTKTPSPVESKQRPIKPK